MRSYLIWAADQTKDPELKDFWTRQADEIVPFIKMQFEDMATAVMEY